MTDVVFPSPGRGAVPDEWAALSRFAAATGKGFVVTNDTRLVPGRYDSNIATGPLGGFDISTQPGSLTVTITGGEAFIKGRYVARDTATELTLPPKDLVTIGVGFQANTQDGVVIGKFNDLNMPRDRKLQLWSMSTGPSEVGDPADRRPDISLASELTHGNNAHDPQFSEASHDHTGETINPQTVNLDTINTADVSAATENQVLKKAGTGSDLTFAPAAPAWQEDPNSPFTATNVTSKTFTLSDTFDLWRFHVKLVNNSTSANLNLNIQINSQTSQVYNTLENLSDSVTQGSFWRRLISLDASQRSERRGTFQIEGRWGTNSSGDGTAFIRSDIPGFDRALQTGEVRNVSPPLDSITMQLDSADPNYELTLEAYGRDI